MKTRRNSFARLRSGAPSRKTEIWALPVASGAYTTGSIDQLTRMQQMPGHLGNTIQAQWLWALTPEILERTGLDPIPGLFWDDNDNVNNDDRFRIVGITGSLYYTPIAPLAASGASEGANCGMVGISFTKFDAQNFTTVSGENRPTYPFTPFGLGGPLPQPITQEIGVTPYLTNVLSPQAAQYADYRTRRGRVMFKAIVPWRMEQFYNVDEAAGECYAGPSVRIPLPRKLLCNIGKGEAVGVAVWQKDFGTNAEASGSPSAVLSFHDVKIKLHKLE